MYRRLSFALFVTFGFHGAMATNWHVGPTQDFTLPSQVVGLVNNGDTIYLDGGVYSNDAVKWTKNNLVIIGLGTPDDPAVLQYSGDIPNHKGIFVFETPGDCDNAYIENIVFDGAQVSDADGGNGAGIRYQAKNLTVNHCIFRNCQNGILEGNGSVFDSNVIIINCEFYNNGYQVPDGTNSGYVHHMYISASTDTLLVTNCYFHHPRGQANSLKTRAQRSYILYNLIDEESTGYGSWELNIAQGGLNVVMGNVIIQGPSGANHGIVGYDAVTNELQDFYFINNTVINQYVGNVHFFNTAPAAGINTYKIYNNLFASVPGANLVMFSGNEPAVLDSSNNIISSDYLNVGFVNPSINDYALTADALSAIDQGTLAGSTNSGYSLLPTSMYTSFDAVLQPRVVEGGAIDVGAYEYAVPIGTGNRLWRESQVFPNPNHGSFTWMPDPLLWSNACTFELFACDGTRRVERSIPNMGSSVVLDFQWLPEGVYLLRAVNAKGIFTTRVIIAH